MTEQNFPQSSFRWVPGRGPDETARQRLLNAFPRPTAPMGEPWFMSSERRMYTEALDNPVTQLDLDVVREMFDGIVTGPPCFGQMKEWQEWFHYLLPNMLPMAFQQPTLAYVAEWLAGGMFSQHPDGIRDDFYRGFRADIFGTLGRVLMMSDIWEEGRLKWQGGLFSQSKRYGETWWYLDETAPPVSAMLFFNLKYLQPNQIEPWFLSVIDIECPLWRAQLIVWFTGARRLLMGEITQPKEFGERESRVKWEWDHVLSGNYTGRFLEVPSLVNARGEAIAQASLCDSEVAHRVAFIPKVNLVAFRELYKSSLRRSVRKDWDSQISRVPLLVREMGAIAKEFVELELTDASN